MLTVSFRGCCLHFKFSFFALLAFCCLFTGATSSAFLLLAVILHESAHLLTMILFGSPPKAVQFSALGCQIVLPEKNPLSYGRSALVSLAGPACNLLCFGIMMLFSQGNHMFAVASFTLGMFHCLPIEPLDGGLALRAILSGVLDSEKAEKITFFLSLILLFPLSVLGFLILLRTRYNFSLLLLSLYLMLYLVLKREGPSY